MRIWVTAMRWIAALSWRLPERLNRIWPSVAPDHAGIGGDSGVAGEGVLAFEPLDAGSLADDLGRGQLCAAVEVEQHGGDVVGSFAETLFQRFDLGGEPDDVGQLGARYFGHQPWRGLKPLLEGLLVFDRFERTRCGTALGVEFVHMPAQPIDRRSTLGHKDITAIGE